MDSSSIPFPKNPEKQTTLPPVYANVLGIEEIKDQIDFIAQEILRITLNIKHKNIKDINKNFQATLTNYFLECQVCQLLTKPMNVQYKRDVRKIVESQLNKQLSICNPADKNAKRSSSVASSWDKQLQSNHLSVNNYNSNDSNYQNTMIVDQQSTKSNQHSHENQEQKLEKQHSKHAIKRIKMHTPPMRSAQLTSSQYVKKEKTAKYIMLIGIYGDFIDQFGLQNEYIEILLDNIRTSQNTQNYPKDSQKYITLYQKKLCAILVLQHYLCRDERQGFKSFCDLWNSVFLNHKLYYFARETNIFYNKIKINDLIEGYNSTQNKKVVKEKKSKCKLSNISLCEEDYLRKQQKIDSCIIAGHNQQVDINQENLSKSIAQYRNIAQRSPTVNLNYFAWAEQTFFTESQGKCKSFLKILPVQQAVQPPNNLIPQQINYIKENTTLIHSIRNELFEKDYSTSKNSSPSPSLYSEISLPIQQLQKKKTTQIYEDNRDKKQTQVIIPAANQHTDKKSSKYRFNNIKQNQQDLLGDQQVYNQLIERSNSQLNNIKKIKKNELEGPIKQSNVIKIKPEAEQSQQCVASKARYKLIQQQNAQNHPASQYNEYLQQFYRQLAVRDLSYFPLN